MGLFNREKDLQAWIERKIQRNGGIADLIDDLPKNGQGSSWAHHRIMETYTSCMKSTVMLEILTTNSNISLGAKEQLKPDVFAFAPETQSIVIIELKNISGPAREAGTELSAYCAEINNYLPFIADGDIVNVIISVEWPTLLRKHVIQDIIWRGRRLLCLRPYERNGSIRLSPVSPEELGVADIEFGFSPYNVGGYQLCLYDDSRYSEKSDTTAQDIYLPHMRSALSMLATKGNALGSHGFAFLWKDLWQDSLAPYNITIMNVAAFTRLDRFLIDLPAGQELTKVQKRLLSIASEFSPEGHSQTLEELADEAARILSRFCSPKLEGFSSWQAHEQLLASRAQHMAFASWGYFGRRYFDLLESRYAGGQSPSHDCPIVGMCLINSLIDARVPFIDLASIELWDI